MIYIVFRQKSLKGVLRKKNVHIDGHLCSMLIKVYKATSGSLDKCKIITYIVFIIIQNSIIFSAAVYAWKY